MSEIERRATREHPIGEEEASPREGLSPDLQQHIGNRLRALYDGVVNEPIPDRLMMLLNELDASARAPSDRATSDRERSL